eukprot:TRINITY_DN6214_c0_g1_i1.p2 TRINITY_DN6214_c0_g1~~TRINITY_DN6214_c0_g1_i1.p2  ORF type:complete len:110 (+),score=27.11 TRINITY_DN6214_c0_g1_i1:144-473(+)
MKQKYGQKKIGKRVQFVSNATPTNLDYQRIVIIGKFTKNHISISRKCGKNVCDDCSTGMRKLSKNDPNRYRVCDDCDNEMTNWEARNACLLYTSPSPRDLSTSRMPSSA